MAEVGFGDFFRDHVQTIAEQVVRPEEPVMLYPDYLFGENDANEVLEADGVRESYEAWDFPLVLDAIRNAVHLAAKAGVAFNSDFMTLLMHLGAVLYLRGFGHGRANIVPAMEDSVAFFEELCQDLNRMSEADDDVIEIEDNPFDLEDE